MSAPSTSRSRTGIANTILRVTRILVLCAGFVLNEERYMPWDNAYRATWTTGATLALPRFFETHAIL